MKVVVFAGGVGGAKIVDGLATILSQEDLTVVVNTGDDFEHFGLKISPDLDTVCYTLAGLANSKTGWGRRDETWITFQEIAALGGPDWFRLGDKDLGVHLFRTEMINRGVSLSDVTKKLCEIWGVKHPVYPMSDDPVRTMVYTAAGEILSFQEYFVHQACQPVVKSFEFAGVEAARPIPAVLEGIRKADLILFSPSNPWVSIDPILAVPGVQKEIAEKPVIGISPIIGGRALKGPAAKIYREMGIKPSPTAVAMHYKSLLTGFVFDTVDSAELEKIERWRIIALITDTIMKDRQDRVRLAKEVLAFGETILNRSH